MAREQQIPAPSSMPSLNRSQLGFVERAHGRNATAPRPGLGMTSSTDACAPRKSLTATVPTTSVTMAVRGKQGLRGGGPELGVLENWTPGGVN